MITALATPMEAVGAALVEAQAALVHGDRTATTSSIEQRARVQDALAALARTSSDALASWEREATTVAPRTAVTRLSTWHTKFDELRVQVALAEKEVRDSSREVLTAVEHNVAALDKVLVSAGRDIGTAVTTLRDDLRRATHV